MDVSAFFDIPQTSMDTNGRRLSKTSMTCTFGKSDAGFSSKKIRKNQVADMPKIKDGWCTKACHNQIESKKVTFCLVFWSWLE